MMRCVNLFCLSVLTIFLFGYTTIHASTTTSTTNSGDTKSACAGERLPSLENNNPDIECAVLIDDALVFPRNIVAVGGDIWLIDKGSNLFKNGEHKGAIYRYQKSANGYLRTRVLADLNDPNDIGVRQHANGDHWVYFTTRDKVQRFKIARVISETDLQTVIAPLLTYGWHKLAAIHLTQDALYLTVPSSSDHCEVTGLPRLVHYPCIEENNGTALIREYQFDGDKLQANYKVVATGLRDALAVQINFNNTQLIVADNGWDQVDLSDTKLKYSTTPHDEINIIDLSQSAHFGWPYCFDQSSITPGYARFVRSCEPYQPPKRLLPAHSAPLAMLYFNGELLVNLHGNNDSGGKTVSFKVNEDGVPVSNENVLIDWRTTDAPLGRPLGLSKTARNELLVSDDWNNQLIKIVFK